MNLRCAGRLHGSLQANQEKHSDWYKGLRYEVGHMRDMNGADWYVQSKAGDRQD